MRVAASLAWASGFSLVAIMKCQGCALPADAAQRAASNTVWRTARSTGWSEKARGLQRSPFNSWMGCRASAGLRSMGEMAVVIGRSLLRYSCQAANQCLKVDYAKEGMVCQVGSCLLVSSERRRVCYTGDMEQSEEVCLATVSPREDRAGDSPALCSSYVRALSILERRWVG